jgi:hypothetical protein
VILAEVLGERKQRISKIKEDARKHSITCFVSDSVVSECNQKIVGATDYIGNVIKNMIKGDLVQVRNRKKLPLNSPLGKDDILELEKSFKLIHDSTKREHYLTNPIRVIEEWAIISLDEMLSKGVNLTIDQFVSQLVAKTLKVTGQIENLYKQLITYEKGFITKVSVTKDPLLSAKIIKSLNEIGIHDPDSEHIADAIYYKKKNDAEVVFVTFDDGILKNKDKIMNEFGLACCDPLYAIYHTSI